MALQDSTLQRELDDLRQRCSRMGTDLKSVVSRIETLQKQLELMNLSRGEPSAQRHEVSTSLIPGAVPVLGQQLRDAAQVCEDGAQKLNTATDRSDADTPVTAHRLDSGDTVDFPESVWETCLVVGTPCIRWDVSLTLVLSVSVNIMVQVGFVIVIFVYMTDSPTTQDKMEALLRFRVGLGHDVRNSDPVTRRSMMSEVCDSSPRLALSATQSALVSEVTSFLESGRPLNMLAQLMWCSWILLDINSTFTFVVGLLTIPRRRETSILLTETEDNDLDKEFRPLPPIRIASITRRRCFCFIGLIVVPKVIIAFCLAIAGIMYLGVTTALSDLLLNAMALGFILDVDDIFYPIFVPRRVQTLVRSMEPLALPKRSCKFSGSFSVLSKILGMLLALVIIYFVVLYPFFYQLSQLNDVMCSGNIDFVFAKNPASGVVHVAKSYTSESWSEAELNILQVAQPTLQQDLSFNDIIRQAAESKVSLVSFVTADERLDLTTVEVDNLDPDAASFSAVDAMAYLSTSEASNLLKCTDHANTPFAWTSEELQRLSGNSSVTRCSDVPISLCGYKNMTALRSICPVKCACQDSFASTLGFFSGPTWGCPKECEDMMVANSEYQLSKGWYQRCTDLGTDTWEGTYQPHTSIYFSGLLEYLEEQRTFDDYSVALQTLGEHVFNMTSSMFPDFIYFIRNGSMMNSSLYGEVMPGYPHPRNLTGCKFWSSWEIQYLLGQNLCQVGNYRSLRFLCPISCGCSLPFIGEIPKATSVSQWEGSSGLTPPLYTAEAESQILESAALIKEPILTFLRMLPKVASLNSKECPLSCSIGKDQLPEYKGEPEVVTPQNLRVEELIQSTTAPPLQTVSTGGLVTGRPPTTTIAPASLQPSVTTMLARVVATTRTTTAAFVVTGPPSPR